MVSKKFYNTIQSDSDEKDYFLELHNLLKPENMKKLLKIKSQKLEKMLKIKELYSFVYSKNYVNNFPPDARKKMMSKVNIAEAKDLCEFLNSIGISVNESKQKVYYDIDSIESIRKDGTAKKPKPVEYKDKNEHKKVDQKRKEDALGNYDKEYTVEKMHKFIKRKKTDEKPNIVNESKPEFVDQLSKIKKSKLSINTFEFSEKDKINIKNQQKETLVNLTQVVPEEKMDHTDENQKTETRDQSKKNILADREIKTDKGKIVNKKIVYDYKTVNEENNKNKKKVINKNNETDNSTENN